MHYETKVLVWGPITELKRLQRARLLLQCVVDDACNVAGGLTLCRRGVEGTAQRLADLSQLGTSKPVKCFGIS